MSSDETKKRNIKKNKRSSSENFPIQEYRLVPSDHYGDLDEEDVIDLLELAKTIWYNRIIIYKFIAVGLVIGVFSVLLSTKEYVSSATLMPEYSTESQGGASSLLQQYGGLLGISGGGSYNSNSNAIRVDLYPQIVQSISFQDKLARESFYFPDYDTTASLYEYYMDIQTLGILGYVRKFTIGLPGIILGAILPKDEIISTGFGSDDQIIELSKAEMRIINSLRGRITASLDEESGVISVNVKMTNAKLAANIAKYTIEELTFYLVEYRTEKVLRDLEFIEDQLAKAEIRFQESQIALAEFRDSNQGSLTAKARTEEQRLNSEYDLAFNLYNSFTQQFEESKLKVQEETPVFKILNPVQVPVDDETSGATVVIVFLMLSVTTSIGWVLIKEFLAKYTSEEKK